MQQAQGLRRHVPNLLTSARLALCPVILVLFWLLGFEAWWGFLIAAVYAAASITDFLDGYFAKKWSCQTKLGAFIDPFADKGLAWTGLYILFATSPAFPPALLFIYVPVIAFYDLATMTVRALKAAGVQITFETGPKAKERTLSMLVALNAFLFVEAVCAVAPPHFLADALVGTVAAGGLALILVWTIWSGYEYFSGIVGWTPSTT